MELLTNTEEDTLSEPYLIDGDLNSIRANNQRPADFVVEKLLSESITWNFRLYHMDLFFSIR